MSASSDVDRLAHNAAAEAKTGNGAWKGASHESSLSHLQFLVDPGATVVFEKFFDS